MLIASRNLGQLEEFNDYLQLVHQLYAGLRFSLPVLWKYMGFAKGYIQLGAVKTLPLILFCFNEVIHSLQLACS